MDKIEKLIDLYQKDVYAFCLRLTSNRGEADDLYQQTFLKALKLTDKIDLNNNPKSYLFSLTVGIHKNQTRKLLRRENIHPTAEIDEFIENTASSDFNTEDIIIKKEQTKLLEKIISSLPEKQKTPLLLHYMHDYKIEEIAKICRCSSGTVKSRLYTARENVRKELNKYGYE